MSPPVEINTPNIFTPVRVIDLTEESNDCIVLGVVPQGNIVIDQDLYLSLEKKLKLKPPGHIQGQN